MTNEAHPDDTQAEPTATTPPARAYPLGPELLDLLSDIPAELAQSAHRGTSFVPDERAAQERSGYALTLVRDWQALAGMEGIDLERLPAEFARYREGYGKRTRALLAAKSRCLSTMIAGPSNFNTGRARKAGDRADRLTGDLIEFRTRALNRIRKDLVPGVGPIRSGDSDAVAQLREKIAKLEGDQEWFRKINSAIRCNAKHGADAQVAAIVSVDPRITEVAARRLATVPDTFGNVGIAPYKLTNNASNIRRLKGRLVAVERAHAQEPVSTLVPVVDETRFAVGVDEAVPGSDRSVIQLASIRVEDWPAENRVRIFFPGKPAADVRASMKSRGFRWAPSLGAWQAYRGNGAAVEFAVELARKVAGATEQAPAAVEPEASEECTSCGEGSPQGECPKSKRSCGHHCNCSWTQDVCDWCGATFGEVE